MKSVSIPIFSVLYYLILGGGIWLSEKVFEYRFLSVLCFFILGGLGMENHDIDNDNGCSP